MSVSILSVGIAPPQQKWILRIGRANQSRRIVCLWLATIPLSPCFYLKSFGCHMRICVGRWDLPPPRNLVWGQLGGAKVIPSDSPPLICYIAPESSEYLKPPGCRERFSIFVGFCPQNWGLGALRGAKVIPSDSPPSICYFALESSEYLKPFSSYFVASFRDIHTYTHTHIHTHAKFGQHYGDLKINLKARA